MPYKFPNNVGLPDRTFLYTLDQIATLISMSQKSLKAHYVHYAGRQTGQRPREKLRAINIAPEDMPPDWRVTEQELIRWMRHKSIKIYERSWGR